MLRICRRCVQRYGRSVFSPVTEQRPQRHPDFCAAKQCRDNPASDTGTGSVSAFFVRPELSQKREDGFRRGHGRDQGAGFSGGFEQVLDFIFQFMPFLKELLPVPVAFFEQRLLPGLQWCQLRFFSRHSRSFFNWSSVPASIFQSRCSRVSCTNSVTAKTA